MNVRYVKVLFGIHQSFAPGCRYTVAYGTNMAATLRAFRAKDTGDWQLEPSVVRGFSKPVAVRCGTERKVCDE